MNCRLEDVAAMSPSPNATTISDWRRGEFRSSATTISDFLIMMRSKRFKALHFTFYILLFTFYIFFPTSLFSEKYAGEIFKMGAGVRNFALGRTGLTDDRSPALAYWNASLLLKQPYPTFELMHAEEFNGLLKYDTLSGSFGRNHRVGFTLSRIGISNVPMTKLPYPDEEVGPDNRPFVYRSVNNVDYILYMGFARRLLNIPIGITPKVVYRSLADETAYGFGMDIATHFVTNEHVKFGIRVRDAIPTQIYWENGTNESVNKGVDLEVRLSAITPIVERPIHFFINGEINTDAMKYYSFTHVGDATLDPHLGVEFVMHDMISLFAGYDIEFFTAGIGLTYNQFMLHYAFERNAFLDNSHRLSIGYMFRR